MKFFTHASSAVLLAASSFAAADVHGAHHQHERLHHKVAERGYDFGATAKRTFNAVGYYVSWAIYARNWPATNLQTGALTHVLYAFGTIDNKTGEAGLGDSYADVQYLYSGDNTSTNSSSSLQMYGNLKQLYLLKKKNRGLKTLMSIGGWNLRTYFAPALTNNTANQQRFANSSVEILKDHGLDGLDIDWEYPANAADAQALVDTCRLLREALDTYSKENIPGNPHFLLTLSVPAGPVHFQYFNVAELEPYVDLMNLMGYDYQGSGFSNYSGHDANLYKSTDNPKSTDYDTETPVRYYLGAGLPPQKLNLGMPLYGRSFANTSGPGTRFADATDGSWENGVWDYKALPLNKSSTIYKDLKIGASWSYSNQSRYMVSYDIPEIAVQKAQYIETKGLGGGMWWETSGDRPLNDSRSLIGAVTNYFKGCGVLECSQNNLDYPTSKYANVRDGMSGE